MDELLTSGGNSNCTDNSLADSDLRRLHREGRLQLTLTDHNSMSPRQRKLELPDAVVQIIDHHQDDGQSPQVTGAQRVIGYGNSAQPPLPAAAAIGSACTLVAQAYLAQAPELLVAEPLVAKLLLAGILIDTTNLSPHAGKTQLLDISTVSRLYEVCGMQALPPQDEFAAQLKARKFDPLYWATVPPADLLRADFKQYTDGGVGYGMASVLLPLSVVVTGQHADALASALTAYSSTHGLDVLVMMSFSQDAGPRRQLLLHVANPRLRGALAHYLEETLRQELGLQRIEPLPQAGSSSSQQLQEAGVLLYEQTEIKASRKLLAPMLQAFFSMKYEDNPYVKKARSKQ